MEEFPLHAACTTTQSNKDKFSKLLAFALIFKLLLLYTVRLSEAMPSLPPIRLNDIKHKELFIFILFLLFSCFCPLYKIV
jgi:hypothetical protein